jgi:hypothetical protein
LIRTKNKIIALYLGGTTEGLVKALATNNMVLSTWDEGKTFLASFGAYKSDILFFITKMISSILVILT